MISSFLSKNLITKFVNSTPLTPSCPFLSERVASWRRVVFLFKYLTNRLYGAKIKTTRVSPLNG